MQERGMFHSIAIKGEAKNGYVTVVRYDRSFIARIIQNDMAKRYYSEIKNFGIALGMRSRISWKGDTFYIGRKTFAIAKVRGRTLCIYLALDPTRFEESIYHQTDVSGVKSYENTPMMVKVRSDLALKKAKELMRRISEEQSLVPKEITETDYAAELPYEETSTLVMKGLIKEIENVMKVEDAEKALADAEKAEDNDEETEWVEFESAEEEDEEPEEVIFELAEDGQITEIRYDRSFTARIIQNDKAKQYYSELKNYCLRFPLKSRISWKADTFRKGRKPFVLMKVRGKTFAVYLALDPSKYDVDIYHQKDVSDIKAYEKCPMMVKIRSDLALRKVKSLITEMMEQVGYAERYREAVDYVAEYPYEETEDLIEKKLIKKIVRIVSVDSPELPLEDQDLEEVEFELADEEEPEEVEFESDEELEEAEFESDEEPEEAEFESAEEDTEESEEEEEVDFVPVDEYVEKDTSGEMLSYEQVSEEGKYVTLKKYIRSFLAKMKQGPVERKDRYAAVKSEIMSISGVKVRRSLSGETFMFGKQALVKSRVRGKTLCLFFALEPDDYARSIYHQQNKKGVKAFIETPMMVRVKSEQGMVKAIYLVGELTRRFSLSKGEKHNYRAEFRYEDTADLLEKGYIKTKLVTVPKFEAEDLLNKREN